jgi:hypothetical protein
MSHPGHGTTNSLVPDAHYSRLLEGDRAAFPRRPPEQHPIVDVRLNPTPPSSLRSRGDEHGVEWRTPTCPVPGGRILTAAQSGLNAGAAGNVAVFFRWRSFGHRWRDHLAAQRRNKRKAPHAPCRIDHHEYALRPPRRRPPPTPAFPQTSMEPIDAAADGTGPTLVGHCHRLPPAAQPVLFPDGLPADENGAISTRHPSTWLTSLTIWTLPSSGARHRYGSAKLLGVNAAATDALRRCRGL